MTALIDSIPQIIWFIKVLTVVGAIIVVLVILKWTFGEWTAAIVGGGMAIIALLALAALARPAKKVIEERRKR